MDGAPWLPDDPQAALVSCTAEFAGGLSITLRLTSPLRTDRRPSKSAIKPRPNLRAGDVYYVASSRNTTANLSDRDQRDNALRGQTTLVIGTGDMTKTNVKLPIDIEAPRNGDEIIVVECAGQRGRGHNQLFDRGSRTSRLDNTSSGAFRCGRFVDTPSTPAPSAISALARSRVGQRSRTAD